MRSLIPLVMLREGKKGRISHIEAGRGLTRRLIEMGFVEGAIVRVLGRDIRGHVMVVINSGSKYALGRGVAMKIIVEDSHLSDHEKQ